MFGPKPFLKKIEYAAALISLLVAVSDAADAKNKPNLSAITPGKTEKNARSIASKTPPNGESQAELMLRTVKQEDPEFLTKSNNDSPKNKKAFRVEKAKSITYGRPGFTEK